MHLETEVLREEIPKQCIRDCSCPGRDAYPFVTHWIKKLNLTVNRKQCQDYLATFGAWTRDELANMTDLEITEKILWSVCCDFREDPDRDGVYLGV